MLPATVAGRATIRTVARTDVPSEATCTVLVNGTESFRSTLHSTACDWSILVREVVS